MRRAATCRRDRRAARARGHAAPTSSTGSRASAAMRARTRRVRGILREQMIVLAHHHAAAARGDDDRLGAALDVRPPGVDVAARERARFVVLGQVIRERAAAAAASRRRSPRCRRDRARAPLRRRCSAPATAARSLRESAPGAHAAARAMSPAALRFGYRSRQPARQERLRPTPERQCGCRTATSTAVRAAARRAVQRRPARGRRDRRRTCGRCRRAARSERPTDTSSRNCGTSGSDRGGAASWPSRPRLRAPA